MMLSSGTRLGAYEVLGSLGAGGMGEVYRARDTQLGREVAIKVLPAEFAHDAERLARFEREAQTLAALNHPHIATIHGVVDSGGVRALVMELVEGETLAERIAHGALPVDEALRIARQIAVALETAHEQGIIHRDLKPANIKVRPDGTVKVLDFGLAKVLDPTPSTAAGLTMSPTLTSPVLATGAGVLLGTAAYMSPEQAKGRPADKRADIWAFGCVLYEMLTGRRAFEAADVTETLARILMKEPDWDALPPETPALVRMLMERCVAKAPHHRVADIAAALFALTAATELPALPAASGGTRARRTSIIAAGVAVLAGSAVLAALWLRSGAAPSRAVVRTQIAMPGTSLTLSGNYALALDPAGRTLVFAGRRPGEPSRLYRRLLSEDSMAALAGTEEAIGPVFSPDGEWLLFFQGRKLRRMPARGGAAADVADAIAVQGASVAPDGSVVFNPQHGEGLLRLPRQGGAPEPLTAVERNAGEAGHHWPHVLPGGTHVIATIEIDGKSYSEARIVLISLSDGERRVLIDGGSDARYVPTGHLVYWRAGDLWAVPFDLKRLEVTGAPVVVVRNVMASEANGLAHYSISTDGSLAYIAGADVRSQRIVAVVDRTGASRPLIPDRKAFADIALSPDGRRLAATVVAANDSLWVLDLERSTLTRLTFEAENAVPVWSPDGRRLAFGRHRGGEPRQLYVVTVDEEGVPALLHKSSRPEVPQSWSAAGQLLAFTRIEEATSRDIWVLPMGEDRTPRPLIATRFDETQPHVSPDGRWVAYTSNESGRYEIYLRPFPGPGQRRQVSIDGGYEPRWRRDARELFYRNEDAVLSVDLRDGVEPSISRPRLLFRGDYVSAGYEGGGHSWDVFPDGQRFVFVKDLSEPLTTVSLILNWTEELKRLVPAN